MDHITRLQRNVQLTLTHRYDVGLTSVLRFSGVVSRMERVRMHITAFGEKNFPLDYFVGHKHGRMISCQ